ncbi:hypothetical protein SAMN02745671_01188 [Anaerovibrio lipolyticus DSM 3074]|uniref:DUF488 domain-containing protein n=2 Tax=Anaerovibrio lipolyticus TaxID=82374 RepID=A0A1M6CMM3_9FIRM|nr:hypothetical protein SAMN02745671_01188 [Anaerovibrio lipolyticus DSM 3074]
MIYVSRYANPELRKGLYTPVRISIGTPKWPLGYILAGEIKELMPFGLKDIGDIEEFKQRYFNRLDRYGVDLIQNRLDCFTQYGRDVVLLCYEDIRKGPADWCHRTMFAEWWKLRTGELIGELKDESKFKKAQPKESNWVELPLF